MTTQDPARLYPLHNHGAFLNKEGNGNTDVSAGHYHRVSGFRVRPDLSDGHSHEMTMAPCGWGAPHTVGRDGEMQLQLGAANDTQLAPVQHGLVQPPKLSVWPWVLGAVMVSGLVIGGVILMRSDS